MAMTATPARQDFGKRSIQQALPTQSDLITEALLTPHNAGTSSGSTARLGDFLEGFRVATTASSPCERCATHLGRHARTARDDGSLRCIRSTKARPTSPGASSSPPDASDPGKSADNRPFRKQYPPVRPQPKPINFDQPAIPNPKETAAAHAQFRRNSRRVGVALLALILVGAVGYQLQDTIHLDGSQPPIRGLQLPHDEMERQVREAQKSQANSTNFALLALTPFHHHRQGRRPLRLGLPFHPQQDLLLARRRDRRAAPVPSALGSSHPCCLADQRRPLRQAWPAPFRHCPAATRMDDHSATSAGPEHTDSLARA
ncbi:hypothetical protein L1887_43665 [Cichorium endivia]|nr:hypothetical protein L1887_43665 [Cichorium endivia]